MVDLQICPLARAEWCICPLTSAEWCVPLVLGGLNLSEFFVSVCLVVDRPLLYRSVYNSIA